MAADDGAAPKARTKEPDDMPEDPEAGDHRDHDMGDSEDGDDGESEDGDDGESEGDDDGESEGGAHDESEEGDDGESDEEDSEEGDDEGEEATEESPYAETLADWLSGKPLTARAHVWAGLITPLVIALANMWRLKEFTVDDSYISYRYANNLARGLGLVYNTGERIEGYTNFLWTVLLAAGARIGVAPPSMAKVLGFACGLAAVALSFHIESRLRELKTLPALSPYLLATTTAFMGYSVFGLETPLFVALVLGGIALMMHEEREPDPSGGWSARVPWSGVAFGLAGLTRPEAPMFLGLMMLFLHGKRLLPVGGGERRPALTWLAIATLCAVTLWYLKEDAPTPLMSLATKLAIACAAAAILYELPRDILMPRNLLRGGLFVAIVGAHLLWRKSYYGAWVPNTLGAKTGNIQQQLSGGFDYVTKFALHEGPLLILVILGIGVALASRSRVMLAFAATAACVTTYIVLVGGDWMPMFRFAAPLQPFLYLLVGVGVRTIVEERNAKFNWGVFLVALGVCAHRAERVRSDRATILTQEKAFWDRAAGGASRWFNLQFQARGREAVAGELAIGDIGQVGYETDLPIVDLLGLVDLEVSKLPGGYTHKIGPGFTDYFFRRKPRYFLLISAQNDCRHPSVTGSIAIGRDHRFQSNYTVSGRVMLTGGFSWCLFERSDIIDRSGPALVVNGDTHFTVERAGFESSGGSLLTPAAGN
jgi:hypothetical protein